MQFASTSLIFLGLLALSGAQDPAQAGGDNAPAAMPSMAMSSAMPTGTSTPTPTPDSTPDSSPTPTPDASPSPTPEASPSPTPSPDDGGNSSSGAGEQQGKCDKEGQFNCIGGAKFQRCAAGQWSKVLPMAAGTHCKEGQSDTLWARSRFSRRWMLHKH